MIGFVYMWTNLITGKKYIGMHVGDEHDGYEGSGVYFRRAVDKYGIDNFERVVLYREYDDVEALWLKEHEIINDYNAVFDEEYYNLTNFSPKQSIESDVRTRVVVPETRKKLSKSRTGKKWIHKFVNGKKITRSVLDPDIFTQQGWTLGLGPQSEEHIAALSRVRKGKPNGTAGESNGMFGKKWFNNGIETKPFIPGTEPDGWTPGSLVSGNSGESNGFFGRSHSEETKRLLSEKCGRSGNENGFYGQTHSEEAKQAMSKAKAGKIVLHHPKTKKRKFVDPRDLDYYLGLGYYNRKYNKEQKW